MKSLFTQVKYIKITAKYFIICLYEFNIEFYIKFYMKNFAFEILENSHFDLIKSVIKSDLNVKI